MKIGSPSRAGSVPSAGSMLSVSCQFNCGNSKHKKSSSKFWTSCQRNELVHEYNNWPKNLVRMTKCNENMNKSLVYMENVLCQA